MAIIAVTGASGRVGGKVARRLHTAGIPLRLIARDLTRMPHLPGTEQAPVEYADRRAALAALHGIRTVFFVSAGESIDRVDRHMTFVDAAVDAGVEHLVYLSFLNAKPDATFRLARHHAATEECIRASGVPFTFLRDSLYADFVPAMVGGDGVIRGPAGDGRVSVVAQDDIAEAASAVLQAPDEHAGMTYDLTGPQALSFYEIAATTSRVTGRAVRYHNETLDEAYASRAGHDAPGWLVDAWVSTYTAVAAGEIATVSDDVTHLLGHPATPLHAVLPRERADRS